ncbi:chemotaxis protein CheB [Pedobacter sp. WC2423]|uniref:chemotaxis protein CheB n=1 Tax=Pedobacter sp. WC2423 TaxID=3234142 RepID=UPI00346567E2
MNRFYVLGIGASTGAQQSLSEFFNTLDSDLPVAIIFVSPMHDDYLKKTEEILHHKTKMKISILEEDMTIEKGNVYLIPEKFVLRTECGRLKVMPRKLVNENIIDIFFESLANDYRELAVGIILSGRGKDGVKGAMKISNQGGCVLVQEPFSALYQSLPREVVKVDHPYKVLPAVRLAALVNQKFRQLL